MTKTGAAARPELEDRTESAMDWVRTNGKALAAAAILVAVLVAGVFLYRQWRASRAEAAERVLSTGRQSYAQGNLPLAQTDLRRVITGFGGTSAASQATMLLAQVYYEQGKPDSGLAVLNEGRPAGPDEAAFEALKGAGLEQKGEFAQAAQRYRAAAQASSGTSARQRYLADAARALAAGGDKAEAAAIWSQLAEDESSAFAAEARVRYGELSAKPAGTP